MNALLIRMQHNVSLWIYVLLVAWGMYALFLGIESLATTPWDNGLDTAGNNPDLIQRNSSDDESASDNFLQTLLIDVSKELFKWTGYLAVIMIIWAGARRIFSAFNESEIENSNKIFKNAVLGILAALVAVPVVQGMSQLFVYIDEQSGSLTEDGVAENTQTAQNTLTDIINGIGFGVIGPIAVIAIMWISYRYLFAYGDENKVQSATKAIGGVLVGIIMLLLAYGIISFLVNLSL